jgi:hypothetical protein
MNSEQILLIMNKLLSHSWVHFLGVFASDRLPSQTAIIAYSPCCYIVNTDRTGWNGSHWVAFFHPTPFKLEFFDSFAKMPKERGMEMHKSFQIQHNSFQVQGDGSAVCGHLCVYFLYHRARGLTMHKIIHNLNSLSFSASEALVYSFVQRVMQRINRK